MSTWYSAQLMVGCEVPTSKVWEEVTTWACPHAAEWAAKQPGMKYCPTCGVKIGQRPMWKKLFGDDTDKLLSEEAHGTWPGYEADLGGNLELQSVVISYRAHFVAGVSLIEGVTTNELAFRPWGDNWKQLSVDLRLALEPLGLWNEASFGLYLISAVQS